MKAFNLIIAVALSFNIASAQNDTINSKWTYHFQLTVISQKHSAFHSAYSGLNSLTDTVEPTATSLTSTLFLGRKLWKNASIYFNPEISGGNGLSFTKGVAGALNGETYRVGNVSPQPFIARIYLQQIIPLRKADNNYQPNDINQVASLLPESYIAISAGKFSIGDFFDDNIYCKDPRTQFLNWSLWANGAWDYPADTKGYTEGLVVELIEPSWAIRFSSVAMPRIANYHLMEYNADAHSETLEIEHKLSILKKSGKIRLLLSSSHSQAPSYADGIKAIADDNTLLLNVISGQTEHKSYGGKKVALCLNVEQQLSNDIGFFSRTGWNDGKYATWAFTEIDQTINAGISIKGNKWKRPGDVLAIAGVVNGISKEHKNFLQAGGYGFIIGDGKLNYGHEAIVETYYNSILTKSLSVSIDYQFVNNPGYNKDRGPVHVFGIRMHIEF